MKKKYIAFLLTILAICFGAVFAMTGCSSGTDTASATEETTVVEEVVSEDAGSGEAVETTGKEIGEDKAKEVALKDAGFSEGDVKYLNVKLDYDDGRTEYEVDFQNGEKEYEYTVDAVTGDILEKDVDSIYD